MSPLRFDLDVNPKPFTQGLHHVTPCLLGEDVVNTITSLVLASVLMTSCEGLPDNPKWNVQLSHFRTNRRAWNESLSACTEATEAKSEGTSTKADCPRSTCSTHSVLSRSTTQGVPREKASFCTPPLSVKHQRGVVHSPQQIHVTPWVQLR